MEFEHQPVLDEFEPHNSEHPVEETHTFNRETISPGPFEHLVGTTEDSLPAAGNDALDYNQGSREKDVETTQWNGCAGGEPTSQDSLDTNEVEE